MEATTQNFGKRFFINRSCNFIALLNFNASHLGITITGSLTCSWGSRRGCVVLSLLDAATARKQRRKAGQQASTKGSSVLDLSAWWLLAVLLAMVRINHSKMI
jgi:hypothetical protein